MTLKCVFRIMTVKNDQNVSKGKKECLFEIRIATKLQCLKTAVLRLSSLIINVCEPPGFPALLLIYIN